MPGGTGGRPGGDRASEFGEELGSVEGCPQGLSGGGIEAGTATIAVDEGRENRPGTGSAWRQRHETASSPAIREPADSDAAAAVLSTVIARVLSTGRKETGGRAWTATVRQQRPDAARLDANPSSSCAEMPGRPRSRRLTVQVRSEALSDRNRTQFQGRSRARLT